MINIRLLDGDNVDVTPIPGGIEMRPQLAGFIGQYSGNRFDFKPGEINITKRAYAALGSVERVIALLDGLFASQWGEMPDEDKDYNTAAVKRQAGSIYDWHEINGERLLIQVNIGLYTTIMLAAEY